MPAPGVAAGPLGFIQRHIGRLVEFVGRGGALAGDLGNADARADDDDTVGQDNGFVQLLDNSGAGRIYSGRVAWLRKGHPETPPTAPEYEPGERRKRIARNVTKLSTNCNAADINARSY